MKIEDIKIGTKVKLISTEKTGEHLGYEPTEMLSVGSVLEVIETFKSITCDHVELSDRYYYAVEDLELYEELNNLGKLTVSISLEDKEEVAKDILKIVLQDLNVVISDAIESLSDEFKEFYPDEDLTTIKQVAKSKAEESLGTKIDKADKFKEVVETFC